MILVFDIASSAVFWRKHYPANRRPGIATNLDANDVAYRKMDIQSLLPPLVTDGFLRPTGGVFHALAFESDKRRESAAFVTHTWSGPLPEGSFFRLSKNVYVESPEFMFLHAASILNIHALIAFGDELCGFYGFDEFSERGFRKRKEPLTTKNKLDLYLDNAKGCHGQRLARRALEHVIEHSASPMETFDEMSLALPYKLGGYGFRKPTMNQPVTLSFRAARIAGKKTCVLDMGYLEHDLDIEHHGKHDHSTENEIASDRARVNALREMGIDVVELTIEQVGDLVAYEYIVERIAKTLHKRIRKTGLGATPERLAFRDAVFQWNESYGRVR